MNELSPIKNLRNLKKDMADMTYGQKLKHIWTYYKWVLVVVLILIMLVSVLLAAITNKRSILMLGGVTVNVQLSEEGKAYIGDEYLQTITTGNTREKVVVSHTDIEDVSQSMLYENNHYAVMSLLALCSNQEVDFLILDQVGFETMLAQGAYLGLNQIYTAEELEEMKDVLVYAQNKDETVPSAIALDITDTKFVQENTEEDGNVYFVYITNSLRKDTARDFYEYILAYGEE